MTRIFYDCEFHERGYRYPIDFISIGMVRDDGAEYYAITDRLSVIMAAASNHWLRMNVLPSLPGRLGSRWGWDPGHPDFQHVKGRAQIAIEVREFVLDVPDPQLWGWYSDYDHVVLCQLFGRMIDLPEGFPMFTNDLRQKAEELGNPALPEQAEGVHNALADARHNMIRAQYLLDTVTGT